MVNAAIEDIRNGADVKTTLDTSAARINSLLGSTWSPIRVVKVKSTSDVVSSSMVTRRSILRSGSIVYETMHRLRRPVMGDAAAYVR